MRAGLSRGSNGPDHRDRGSDLSTHATARAADFKHQAKQQFDAWAERYDRSLLHHFLFRPSYVLFMEELARWRRGHTGTLRLLDVGCGTGSFARMIARTDWSVSVVGLDYSPSMCKEADAKRGGSETGSESNMRFVAGDSEHLPFEGHRFDVVTCANSFHHYPHQRSVIQEMKRVLRPGGRLMLLDGFRDNAIGWFVFDVAIGSIEKQVHHAPWSEIRSHFIAAEFANIVQRKINVLFPAVCTMGDA